MKIQSKIKLGILSIAAAIIVGCSGSSSNNTEGTTGTTSTTPSTNSATSTEKKFKIGISIPAADHGWTAGIKYWAEDEAKKHPEVEFDIQTADSPAKQITQLEAMGTKKLDAVVILATESAPVSPAAKKLKDQGIFLVNVDRGFTSHFEDIFLAGDNKKFGTMSAEFMAKKLNGKGNILVLEGIPCTVNTDRVEAFKAVFSKYPGLKILASQTGMWNQQKAQDVMQTMLTANKQVDAIWAGDDDMALGAEKALKAAGRDKNIWMFGGAGMKDIVKRVMDGDAMFPADITYPPSMIAQGIKECVDALTATKKEDLKTFKHKDVEVKVEMIEPANAKDFYFKDSVY
jgi:ribose transport system substrate-binding protein